MTGAAGTVALKISYEGLLIQSGKTHTLFASKIAKIDTIYVENAWNPASHPSPTPRTYIAHITEHHHPGVHTLL